MPIFAECNANEIGGIFRSKLFHDVGPMHLERTCADSEIASAFFVRRTGGNLSEHLVLTLRQSGLSRR